MKATPDISATLTIKELLDRYPQLLPTFMALGLLCVGCPAEAFHTLDDVAREYGLDLNELRQRLVTAVDTKAPRQGTGIAGDD